MTEKQEKSLYDIRHATEDFSDPPPAYSARPYSAASSEASLLTVEPDFAPDFTNESNKGGNVASFDDFNTNVGLGSRTSAFIQAFMRPKVQPRMVNLGLGENDTSVSEIRDGSAAAPMDIVIMVVGEAIEPFILIAKKLLSESHRVRIAAHASCEAIVRSQGLDFFPISHDSIHPMSIVHSGGLDGKAEHLRHLRHSLFESYHGSWRACIASYRREPRPFLADAIIATPLAHAHIHCAERLSIPLHIMSTALWNATKEFPHPLSHVEGCEEVDEKTSNLLSYALVEESIWNVIIEPINRFRQQILGFQGISSAIGGRLVINQEVPQTYLCSGVVLSRPKDWSNIIGIPLIFSPNAIQNAVTKQGFRVILSPGCRDPRTFLMVSIKDELILILTNVDTEWLLPRVSVVVHHGNSDDIALALRHGKPSVVLPHSGDQLSRGIAISKLGAAAAPLMSNMLSSDSLSQAVAFGLRPDVQQSTQAAQSRVIEENGLNTAIQSFYRWLPSHVQICSITQQDLAMYQIWNKPSLRVSPEAAAILLEERLIRKSDIVLIPRRSYSIELDKLSALQGTARDYWDGVSHAAKSIATSSDLVSMLPGLQLKASSSSDETGNKSKEKRNIAKDVGIGTAKIFGHIALLPFTINSVAYGVKAAAGDTPPHTSGPSKSLAAEQSTPGQTAKNGPPSSRSNASQIQARDDEHVQAICRRHLERGYKSPKLRHPEFKKMVLDRFNTLSGGY
ncbi:UDP-Glycosyltransferase/glycogen phosphorylase [Aspergillus sclerotioniger CBS 115572]|uniref:UDP-Glycosyltransferase/glycogen phosphorylase n=1 Tax=Aspergillus sclerotioniger CBS 115572 TaxID=1450535 RepID=A0A317WVH2_9EURO|nr:UDP-Glycosyltransferase/glycogen phosphorylase [Aspergillus sclerotioniger CBS 115572]PWY90414.1 UDP-Glycosyltransferase/glycogen phosphorylase [Aspergillus sclerotioniger CBS 115572]